MEGSTAEAGTEAEATEGAATAGEESGRDARRQARSRMGWE